MGGDSKPEGGKPLERPRKPDFEKLVIGPLMVLGEMTTGGHYLEMLKIIKQAQNIPYPTIAKDLWKNEGFLGFYKGFAPWGALQMVKGIPVLFIQGESEFWFKKWGMPEQTAETLAGVMGGIGQGIFITPTQRLKTIVMTDPKYAGVNAPKTFGKALVATTSVAVDVVKSEGLGTLFKGVGPMMGKRGFDWGFRFYGVSVGKKYFQDGNPKKKLSFLENLAVGFFGGALSTLTMPFDSWVSNCQKATRGADGKRQNLNAIQVAQEMWRVGGAPAFVRGWAMRLMHAGYHTMWMYSIGNLMLDWWKLKK
jgi:hypothetical protein